MATSTEQLNDAITALMGAAAAYNGKKSEIDGALAASQAGYSALAANLKGVVTSQMHFTGVVDPDEPNPTNVDGGTFTTIAALIAAAPAGSYVVIYLVAGKTHEISTAIVLLRQRISFYRIGAGSRPVIKLTAYSTGAHNNLNGFRFNSGGGYISVQECDVELPFAKVDPALPWSATVAFCGQTVGNIQQLGLWGVKITGGSGLAMMHTPGAVSLLSTYSVTLDGNVHFFNGGAGGVALLSHNTTTLLNGASIASYSPSANIIIS